MNKFCCRICFMSEKDQLLLLQLKKDDRVYSDMVKFVAGIEVCIKNSTICKIKKIFINSLII